MAAGIKASADGLYGTLQVNSADVVTFNDSGNVGIGTLAPTQKLDITNGRIAMTEVYDIRWLGAASAIRGSVSADSGSNLYFGTGASNTERMRIDSSGNVGIGTSSPTNRLQLSSTGNPGLVFDGTNQGTDLKRIRIVTQIAAAGDFAIQSMNDAGTVKSTNLYIDSSANLKFNSGYGSAATAYGCRAWVNFNGTGTVAIRASGNVSSITDNGVGDYTVNFTTAMPDANYSVGHFTDGAGGLAFVLRSGGVSFSSSSFRVGVFTTAGAGVDKNTVTFSVFR